MRATWKWLVGIVLGALAAWGTTLVTSALSDTWETATGQRPIQIATSENWLGYRVIPRPQSQLPRSLPRPPDDAFDQVGAVNGNTTLVQLTVTGREDAVTVLTDMQVRVLARRPPMQGTVAACEIGDAIPERNVNFDLDTNPPTRTYSDDRVDGSGLPIANPEEAIDFPYKVSKSMVETFVVHGFTKKSDVDWVIELTYVDGDKTKVVSVDNDGVPFRTTTIEGLPSFNMCTKPYGD